MAHVIKVDMKAEVFSYTIDEDKKRYHRHCVRQRWLAVCFSCKAWILR